MSHINHRISTWQDIPWDSTHSMDPSPPLLKAPTKHVKSCAGESWQSADIVDCILSYAATGLVDAMTDPYSEAGREMLDAVKADARASKQMLLLAHLYAKTDAASLARLRRELLRPKYTLTELAAGTALGTAVVAGRQSSSPFPTMRFLY